MMSLLFLKFRNVIHKIFNIPKKCIVGATTFFNVSSILLCPAPLIHKGGYLYSSLIAKIVALHGKKAQFHPNARVV